MTHRIYRGACILGVGVLALCLGPLAQADRVGGRVTDRATVQAYQSLFFEVEFLDNHLAAIAIAGNGQTNLALFLFDADGHVAVGVGRGDRKMASMNVSRTGTFRVEVRNLGSRPNTFVISTN